MVNRLANSQSLYLRKHAENPIDWFPWGEEALTKAKTENKPIFLSIGYSSCHWCTVMEGEAFSDEKIADFMNNNFVPIKVDREERPDIDSIYMQALQVMIGQGGWPLNVFLDCEDLIPFYGGTYFPLEPRYGRPGFLQLLQAIHRFYYAEKNQVDSVKGQIFSYLQQTANIVNLQGNNLTVDLLQKGLETTTGIINSGGYGNSFPMIPYSDLTLRGIKFNFDVKSDVQEVAKTRGLNLALGGIYDHVAGGFHRYTVDPSWTVPHFEKMLYDNGQIVEFLANLWSVGVTEPAFKRAIAVTVQWLEREMISPDGYFYSAQDADSFVNFEEKEPEEGSFYVWSFAELQQILTDDELTELQQAFTVTNYGNFEGKNVLQRRSNGELSDSLEAILSKLFLGRYGDAATTLKIFPPATNNHDAKTIKWAGRIPAVTDTKMIVAWNSLMISGLARAYSVFKENNYLELAVKAANFILKHQIIEGNLYRLNYGGQVEVLAQSEDYALLIKSLLDLQQADINSADFWLEKAEELQTKFDEFLWSVELGGYYNNSVENAPELLVRERGYIDSATPSANGVAIANLVRLFLLTENEEYLQQAEKGLISFSEIMEKSPSACPSLFTALNWYRNCKLIRTNSENVDILLTKYIPTAMLKVETDLPSNSVGLVCEGLSCLEPAKTFEQMWLQIESIGD
jgi:uncharacterized protein